MYVHDEDEKNDNMHNLSVEMESVGMDAVRRAHFLAFIATPRDMSIQINIITASMHTMLAKIYCKFRLIDVAHAKRNSDNHEYIHAYYNNAH